jgi:hypothetical protein
VGRGGPDHTSWPFTAWGVAWAVPEARYTRFGLTVVQRALTTIVLLCFALGPGLNLSCLARCAPISAAAAPADNCHQSADSDLEVTSVVDCAEHQAAQPPALIAGRGNVVSAALFGLVAYTLPQPRQTLSLVHGLPSLLTAGPPPGLSAIPLRI